MNLDFLFAIDGRGRNRRVMQTLFFEGGSHGCSKISERQSKFPSMVRVSLIEKSYESL